MNINGKLLSLSISQECVKHLKTHRGGILVMVKQGTIWDGVVDYSMVDP